MGEVVRIHLRLGQKDGDLILLGSTCRITKMVRHAIQFYLGKTDERIPLPPYNEEVPKEAIYTVLLYPETDSEEIEFLQSVPSGYLSTVIKYLLRNAMEKCDLRLILKNTPKLAVRKNAAAASTSRKMSSRRVSAQQSTPQNLSPPRQEDSDEDDIFSGI